MGEQNTSNLSNKPKKNDHPLRIIIYLHPIKSLTKDNVNNTDGTNIKIRISKRFPILRFFEAL